MGLCPCPRCLTPKTSFNLLGLATDMRNRLNNLRVYVMINVIKAREFIYAGGNTVDGAKVDNTLGEGSWIPTLVSDFSYFVIGSHRLLAESICRETWTSRP
jgi:hypothetical protein